MPEKKKKHPAVKSKLHPRSKHRNRYDFKALIKTYPKLADYVALNKYNDESIDFFDPAAVRCLNSALLKHYYQVDQWDIPEGYLCPPVPGRADYIHHVADLLAQSNDGKIPEGGNVLCLDVGVGANCIYPFIGNMEYGWSFIGSEVDEVAFNSAKKIIEANPQLKNKIELRMQSDTSETFKGIIQEKEYIDLTICNPPFHPSQEAANSESLRKLRNLKSGKVSSPVLNFGGTNTELWCEGGEQKFIGDMIRQSKKFSKSVYWFSTLVSKEVHLKNIYKKLDKINATKVETIEMGQGNKRSRIVAWTFLNPKQQKIWMETKWGK